MPPAARITDMHVCPMVTVLVPHVGGPILPPGCPTVLIGGLPAARVTDMATCVGPPDVIVMGSPTVLIGNLMAARIGDPTAHGGVIVLGCFTVMIGEVGMGSPVVVTPMPPMVALANAMNTHTEGATAPHADPPGASAAPMVTPCVADKAGSKIIITGTPEERKKLETILDEIRKTPSGRQLLTNIDNAKNTVEFKLGEAKASGGGVTSFPGGMAKATDKTGTKAIVTLDKDLKDDSLYVYDQTDKKISDPVDVVATHELTHALNVANGTIDSGNPEKQAIEGENQQRTERTPKLTERDPLNHGGGYN